MNKQSLLLLTIFSVLFFSCTQDDHFEETSTKGAKVDVVTTAEKDKAMARFSEILSKAVYEKEEVRSFLKSQALEKIDNGYNVFYPLVKDKVLPTGKAFRDVLIGYSSLSDIEKVEKSVPLLNIHIPEIMGIKVVDIDLSDNEIPILHSNQIYLNGAIVDSLANDEIPGFSLFVVDESGSIQKKQNSLRSSSGLDLDPDYEYVDPVFSPSHSAQNTLRASGREVLDKKYSTIGYVPQKDIDPELLNAYRNSTGNLRATRAMMYYGMTSPTQTPGTVRSDVKDCIFRFKIAPRAFERLEAIATDNGNKPFFHGGTENKKDRLSREEVLRRLLTGRAFCLMFRIEGDINGETVVSEGMKIYATPEQLFNLYINESRRHPTMFRHTKYTYSINKKNMEAKWFYPMDHDHDTRLNRWDVAYQPITKKIVVYLIDPNDGNSQKVEEKYSVTYVTSNEAGANISGKIKEILSIGVNGKVNSTTTTTKEIKTTYTINYKNEKLDEYYFDFFKDYPIEQFNENGYVVPFRIGKGIIEVSILPISDSFYNYGRFQ